MSRTSFSKVLRLFQPGPWGVPEPTSPVTGTLHEAGMAWLAWLQYPTVVSHGLGAALGSDGFCVNVDHPGGTVNFTALLKEVS